MEEEEADFLMGLLNSPLSHANVLRYASDFADLAEQFMDDLISGKLHDKFDKGSDKRGNQSHPDLLQEETNTSHYNDETSHSYKIKWDAMRSYTLDLIDGPVFGMNKWNSSEQSHGEATTEQPDVNPYHEDEEKLPQRQRVMLWMDRLKAALCVVKFSMGPEWMYLWPLTEYGRACIGRNHLEKLISKHVAQRSDRIEHVRRKAGHFIRDFSTTPIPLYAMMENFYYRNETVMGYMNKQPGSRATRPRSQSESALFDSTRNSSIPPPPPSEWTPTLSPTAEDSSHSAPPVVDANNKSARSPSPPPPRPPKFNSMPTPNRMRSISSPQIMELSRKSPSNMKKPKASILDQILSQHDISGQGLSTAVATELSILLYMIMDAGNAWTAMALNLLSLNHNALALVQEEIHFLVGLYGKDKLFIPRVLGKMATVDALLWEAIRLCPPFCGGMKVTTETVVLEEDGVQIPKNANVFFCQPTDQPFDLTEAMGKKPQDLTLLYPNINIHGFLPFKGLEIPIMVLQSKVFIVTLLQRFSPHISKKRTFIRRVRERLSVSRASSADLSDHDLEMGLSPKRNVSSSCDSSVDGSNDSHHHRELTTVEAMKLFTKIPFPEPRLALHVNDRNFSRRDSDVASENVATSSTS
jgi:hypothetical protein